jgi:hypothetical protein
LLFSWFVCSPSGFVCVALLNRIWVLSGFLFCYPSFFFLRYFDRSLFVSFALLFFYFSFVLS